MLPLRVASILRPPTDQGLEFKGEFAEGVQDAGIYQHMVDSRAPHQNGRTKRIGGAIKAQYELAREEFEPTTVEENNQLIWSCVSARNRLAIAQRIRGFSDQTTGSPGA